MKENNWFVCEKFLVHFKCDRHLFSCTCIIRVSSLAPVVAHLSVGCAAVRPACQQQLRRLPAADPSQLTSGEMADLDGSDASPPESQGEFLPTDEKFYSDKLCTHINDSLNDQTLFSSSEDFNFIFSHSLFGR